MGEIQVSREQFLFGLKLWELRAIERGYRRREIENLRRIRWQTYTIMCAIPYCDLKKAGIYKASDLLKLPGDNESHLSEKDINETLELINQANKELEEKRKADEEKEEATP